MSYGYDTKMLKEYENNFPWINQKSIQYWLKVSDKKCASVPTDYPITAYVTTANPITESVPSENPVT